MLRWSRPIPHWQLQHFLSITVASEPARLPRAFISVENLIDSPDGLAVKILNAGMTRTSDTNAIWQIVKMLDMHSFLVTAILQLESSFRQHMHAEVPVVSGGPYIDIVRRVLTFGPCDNPTRRLFFKKRSNRHL